MKKIILIGHVSCGKTTLARYLNNMTLDYKKTQALEVIGTAIDTPGEYLEKRIYTQALVTTSVDVDEVIFVQDASSDRFMFSPGHAASFPVHVTGVVTKADIASEKQTQQAKELLQLAGADPVFVVSAFTGEGMEELREYLTEAPDTEEE